MIYFGVICMAETHLVIVGTSVLRNGLRELGSPEAASCPGGGSAARCSDLVAACADPQRLDRERCKALQGDGECLGLLTCLVSKNPFRMSAELNAMDWVVKDKCGNVRRIVLFASDTPEGRAAADVLSRFFGTECPGVEVVAETVTGLGGEFWPGLLNLTRSLARWARRAFYQDNDIVYLNATGGFKPEAGMAILAAMLAAPVVPYYKHEAMKETVILPQIPLRVDEGRLRVLIGQLLNIAKKNTKIRLGDPNLSEIRWALIYLAKMGVLRRLGGETYEVTDRAEEILNLLAQMYEELVVKP